MSIKIIAAIGLNNELGIDNHLIWDLPRERSFFKNITTGHPVVMGRKTFESLPTRLSNREMIVISSKDISKCCNVECYNKIDEIVYKYYESLEDIYVIGGSSIYDEFLPFTDTMYLTEIADTYETADTYFPSFNPKEWNRKMLGYDTENNIYYEHNRYVRKKKKR